MVLNKTNATLLISEKMFYELDDLKEYPHVRVLEESLDLDDIIITSFHSSHDALDSRNFVIEDMGKKIAYVTDTGYINNKNFWSQNPPERGPWVGTTHQGAPPSPGVPRWVVPTWWPRR